MQLPLVVEVGWWDCPRRAVMLDVGPGGLSFAIAGPPPQAGQLVKMAVAAPGARPIEIVACVRHVKARLGEHARVTGFRVGVMFVCVDPALRARLRGLLLQAGPAGV